ncbi:hypothetical protein BKA70DRAFT_1416243 [Coprinopsis sp. MPI-PUGE-AT-0042]|nr:hypothetical protein BKA70DRAFT_1416243 [Coprinopsis sp. MPI-PUGE-AT-0042]
MDPITSDSSLSDGNVTALQPLLKRIHLAQDYSLPDGIKFRQILHFDSGTKKLAIWWWPVYDEEDEAVLINPRLLNTRVPPGDLEEYRRCHNICTPCCLCAYINDANYVETRIGVVGVSEGGKVRDSTELSGAYIAECAKQICGYSICLEDFYTLPGMRVKRYTHREHPLGFQKVAIVLGGSSAGDGLIRLVHLRGRKRKLVALGNTLEEPLHSKRLRKLRTKGLAEEEFWDMFAQCFRCGHVTLRASFPAENCVQCAMERSATASIVEGTGHSEVIDLTGDSDSGVEDF